MDTNNESAMFVHTGPDSILKAYQCREVLYYFDTSSPNVFNPSVNAYYLLTTAQERKIFHKAEIEGEDSARILQRVIGLPSRTKFKRTVKGTQLQNVSIKVSDIYRDGAIYEPQVAILRVTSVCKHPWHLENILRVPLTLPIEKKYKNINILV